jgi:hypothetical protein
MMKFEYNTGRTYNGPQNLRVNVINVTDTDIDGFVDVDAVFVDRSRDICGRVNLIMVPSTLPERDIGRAVLIEYDAGRYTE